MHYSSQLRDACSTMLKADSRHSNHLWVICFDTKDLCNDFLPKVLVHKSSTGQFCDEACGDDIG